MVPATKDNRTKLEHRAVRPDAAWKPLPGIEKKIKKNAFSA